MSTSYGYVRVSTADQDPSLQIDALVASGIDREHLFIDNGVSGKLASRPALDTMLATVQAGDTLTAWRLDRLGRSMLSVVGLVQKLADIGVVVRTLDGATYDPGTATGRLLLGVLASVADFEHAIIKERAAAGIDAAQRRGVHCGRRKAMSADDIRDAAEERLMRTQAYVAKKYRVSERTLRRHLDAFHSANPGWRRERLDAVMARAVRGRPMQSAGEAV